MRQELIPMSGRAIPLHLRGRHFFNFDFDSGVGVGGGVGVTVARGEGLAVVGEGDGEGRAAGAEVQPASIATTMQAGMTRGISSLRGFTRISLFA